METGTCPEWYLKYAKSKDDKVFQNLIEKPIKKNQVKVKDIKSESIPKRVKDLVENLTAREVAEHLRCDISYVYDKIRSGELRCLPYGKRRIVPVTALYEFLERESKSYYAATR